MSLRMSVVTLALALFSSQLGFSQLLYEFIEVDSKDVLATLELSALPATHEHFVDLTFSESGDAVFGLGSTFPGTFTSMFLESRIRDDGRMGLDGIDRELGLSATMQSLLPLELSPRPGATSDIGFSIVASQLTDRDHLELSYLRPGGAERISRFGTWQLVPEPETSWHWLPVCIAIVMRHRRSQQSRNS